MKVLPVYPNGAKINGVEIPIHAIDSCVKTMQRPGGFRASVIVEAAKICGVPEKVGRHLIAHRLADRMIQKLRRDGLIVKGAKNGDWNWK